MPKKTTRPLTKRLIDATEPGRAMLILWDTDPRGFGLLVLPGGTKSFILQYRNAYGRSRRLTIGRYGALTLDQARAQARQHMAALAAGEDPQEDKATKRAAETIADLLDAYLTRHVNVHNAPSTQRDLASLVATHLKPKIGSVPVKAFAASDAQRLHWAMRDTPRRANLALVCLSVALNLAEQWGLRERNSNPCGAVKKFKEARRDRFLSDAEMQRLGASLSEAETIGLPWAAKDAERRDKPRGRTALAWQAVAAIRLLVLTGARLSEIIELTWEHVDFSAGRTALPPLKGRPRRPRPISSAALAVLAAVRDRADRRRSVYVLPSADDPKRHYTKTALEGSWARLRAACGLEGVRLHDLRHTVGTYGGQAGVPAFVLRDLLGHGNVSTTDRYVNYDADPVRAAADAIGSRVAAGLAGTGAASEARPATEPTRKRGGDR